MKNICNFAPQKEKTTMFSGKQVNNNYDKKKQLGNAAHSNHAHYDGGLLRG
jgi:hypothetical protein